MANQSYILLTFGLSMIIALVIIIAVYYGKRKKDEVDDVESPKYRMMDDD